MGVMTGYYPDEPDTDAELDAEWERLALPPLPVSRRVSKRTCAECWQ